MKLKYLAAGNEIHMPSAYRTPQTVSVVEAVNLLNYQDQQLEKITDIIHAAIPDGRELADVLRAINQVLFYAQNETGRL